jgi:hypothetical protein
VEASGLPSIGDSYSDTGLAVLLFRHVVLHPDRRRHVNLEVQQGSKAGRQWSYNFRQYGSSRAGHHPSANTLSRPSHEIIRSTAAKPG